MCLDASHLPPLGGMWQFLRKAGHGTLPGLCWQAAPYGAAATEHKPKIAYVCLPLNTPRPSP
jgi:hypothetical protein